MGDTEISKVPVGDIVPKRMRPADYIPALRSGDEKLISNALYALSLETDNRTNLAVVIPDIARLVSSGSPDIRNSAISFLYEASQYLDISKAVPALEKVIRDKPLPLAVSALTSHLIFQSKYGEAEKLLRKYPHSAILALRGGAPDAASSFIESQNRSFLASSDPELKRTAARNLVPHFLARQDWNGLRSLLESKDKAVRSYAFEILESDFRPRSRTGAGRLLAMLGPCARDRAGRNPDYHFLLFVTSIVSNHGKSGPLDASPALPAILPFLKDTKKYFGMATMLEEDKEARLQALTCILSAAKANPGQSQATVPSLWKTIHGETDRERKMSAEALVRIYFASKNWKVISDLISSKQVSVNDDVRLSALDTICDLAKEGKDISPLRSLLQDIGMNHKNADMRKAANEALAAIPGPQRRVPAR